MTDARGIHDHESFKLGLVPHDKPADELLAVTWAVDPATIAPTEIDHSNIVPGLDANDRYGDCGPVSAANIERTVSRYQGGQQIEPSLPDVLALYAASTSPSFDPATGANDSGVTNPDLYNAWRKNGLGTTERPIAFARLLDMSDASIALALDVFGAATLAVNLQTAQQQQTSSRLWDYAESGEWGGHDVCIHTISKTSGLLHCWSWALNVAMTQEFRAHQADEVFVPVFASVVASNRFDATVNRDALASDFANLTGEQLDIGPAPDASPDERLATVAKPWVAASHRGANRNMAIELKRWMSAKGL